MDRGRTFLSAIAFISGGFLLAGCSDWSYVPPMHGNFTTEWINHPRVAAGAPPAGGNFIQESAHDYAGLAQYLSHHGSFYPGDYVDVDYFARKGIGAERGALVPPEDNANWAIPMEQPYHFRTQMAEARARLVNDLDNGGRDRFPASPPAPKSPTIAGLSVPRTIGRGNSMVNAIRISSPASRRWSRR